ncbi:MULTISPECIES: hypothetical protein [Pseudomonas]|uniref:Uncharacterized protein n=1 Tax=Pseudomonas fluorescens TaxID=294 RepID=A0A5E7VUP2_PSEFL|nr:hypothetical protein [Pseudomonas fluorescens]VVQ26619.1 hypothetical protein PS928_06787 [Pseudomonas fluorescens]
MPGSIDVDFHGKQHSDFDLKRIARAMAQGFNKPVTAYLTGAFIKSWTCVGVVFGYEGEDPFGRLSDGRIVQTEDVISAQKEGRFWVLSTACGSRYVLATFRAEGGRKTFLDLLRSANGQ